MSTLLYEVKPQLKLKHYLCGVGFIMFMIVSLLSLTGYIPYCQIFMFWDYNGPGPQDDLPFCWTPGEGIIR